MAALSFGLHATRVLVITPAEILRLQTADFFNTLELLKQLGTLPSRIPGPKVFSIESQLGTKESWESLRKYDVVTATPKTTSPKEPGVCEPPADLFDLVFIDEAHHTPAPTWAAILTSFRKAQCVLLTATPFRRDRKRIQAPLVYHYSIGSAIDSGIYRPVDYRPVKFYPNREEQDKEICNVAKRILTEERKRGNQSRLLVRTENVNWANRLVRAYEAVGIKIKAVDYQKDTADNKSAIEEVRQGRIDGMVCVGMLGEGLDLPTLKIAVLHVAPKSLPFTIQFVGRISRFASGQVGDACLIAVPDEVRGEMRRLYKNDANWRKLIPKLTDEIIGRVSALKQLRSSDPFAGVDIDPHDLKPFFSVRLYRVVSHRIDMNKAVELPPGSEICFEERPALGLVVLITESEKPPPWGFETPILETRYDLHILYYVEHDSLLFESTTSEGLARVIRESFIEKEYLFRLPSTKIIRAMRKAESGSYFMVGLKNASGRGPSQPAYKILMGSDTQAAVRPSDGRVFAPGHALATVGKNETRGVGSLQSRIWSIRRSRINEFRIWCDGLVSDLRRMPRIIGLPQLTFLASSQVISKLPFRPIAVLVDDSWTRAILRIWVKRDNRNIEGDGTFPSFRILSFRDGELTCEFCFHLAEPGLHLLYSASSTNPWKVLGTDKVYMRVELSDRDIVEGDLEYCLKEFPPTLLMPNRSVVTQNELWTPSEMPGPLPAKALQAIDWSGCDISAETSAPRQGMKNILDWVEEKLKKETSIYAIIIKDHRSGEIADFVVLEPQTRQITFYHCKGTKGATPSNRVTDAYEVLGQACRNCIWISSPRLMPMLREHVLPPRQSPIIKGSTSELETMVGNFQSNSWTYEVVIVQPGFKCDMLKSSRKIYACIVSTYEALKAAEADLTVWGS